MISRPLRWAAQGAAVAVVAVGALTMAQYDKAVSLSLDGDTSSVHVFGSTVGDLLTKQDVPVGEHDIVQPAADAPLNDGDTVVIRYGRKLTVTMLRMPPADQRFYPGDLAGTGVHLGLVEHFEFVIVDRSGEIALERLARLESRIHARLEEA